MTALKAAQFKNKCWQARRDSNPQHPVLETGALPVGATGLHFVKRPSKYSSRFFEVISSPYARCDAGIGDKTSSFRAALSSSFCFYLLSSFSLCNRYTAL